MSHYFVLVKLTCLVTLFEASGFQEPAKMDHFVIFLINCYPFKMFIVNVAHFAQTLNETFSLIFKHRVMSTLK